MMSKRKAPIEPVQSPKPENPRIPLNQRSGFIIVTLLIAMVGGIPGVCTTIKNFTDKPTFKFNVSQIITFKPEHNDPAYKNKTEILIFGSIVNGGNKPLLTRAFQLFLIDGDTETKLEPEIPSNDTIIIISKTATFKNFTLKQNDFQSLKRIDPSDSKYGSLEFWTDYSQEYLNTHRNIILRFVCIDEFSKEYYSENLLSNETKMNHITNFTIPKNGTFIVDSSSN